MKYRSLAQVLHPDRGGECSRFQELQQSYELLLQASKVPQDSGSFSFESDSDDESEDFIMAAGRIDFE